LSTNLPTDNKFEAGPGETSTF